MSAGRRSDGDRWFWRAWTAMMLALSVFDLVESWSEHGWRFYLSVLLVAGFTLASLVSWFGPHVFTGQAKK